MERFKKNVDSYNVIINLGYIFLMIFALTRPLSLVDMKIPYILDFYSVSISYSLIILLCISARKVKIERTGILIFIFVAYCFASFARGAQPDDFVKLILPFVFYFSVMTFFYKKDQIKNFVAAYKLGFLIPLLASTIIIILGLRIQMVEFWNQVPRHTGVYSGSHVLAYQMLFFSFFFCFYSSLFENHTTGIKSLTIIMFVLSIYCLYQSHTRTAFIGCLIFWSIYLWGFSKKKFVITGVIFIIFSIVFSAQIVKIFLKKEESPDLNRATSGRLELWKSYYNTFGEFTIPEKLLGKGIGWKNPGTGFHNDYLKLLTNIGIFGLILYLFILLSVMYDIYFCPNRVIRYFFGSMLISVIIINFGSNVVISRLELSQLFWAFIGFFYNFNDWENE